MPNRILRPWIDSERINALSRGAECFFVRLIMVADDYGCYHAQGKLLRAFLYPLLDVSLRDIYGWMEECAIQGLIKFYVHNGRDYLMIMDYRQRLRTMKRRFPQPDDGHLAARWQADDCPEEEEEVEGEEEVETETKKNTKVSAQKKKAVGAANAASDLNLWPSFNDFWDAYGKKVDRSKCEGLWKKIKQGAREKIMAHLHDYVPSTPDAQYRKNPATYLRNESWNDEIIETKNKHGKQTSLTDTLLAGIAARANRDDDGPAI